MKNLIFFVLYIFLIFVFGVWEDILILILVVTLHELAHIIAASFFGLKVEKVYLTPIGQMAEIKGMEFQESYKKIIIFLAGPLMNIIIVLLINKFMPGKFTSFIVYNLIIAFLNLLPAIPLDGGRIFQVVVGNRMGVLRANRYLAKLSKIVSIIIIFTGIVQVILYPPNISLLCVGIYISKIISSERITMINDFYKMLLIKDKRIKNKTLKVRNVIATPRTRMLNVLKVITFDDYFIIKILEDENIIYTMTETEFVNYVINYGLDGDLFEIMITYKEKLK